MNLEVQIPQTLFGLVQHYSPTGQEQSAVAWLVQRMNDLGFDQAYADPTGNAIGIKGSGQKQLVLLGHIDTVPGEIELSLKEGNLYGRGSVDAKGPLAAFVDSVAGINVHPDWQVVVIAAVGEEGDSRGAWAVSENFRPDFAIIGEPSRSNRITLGYKGASRAVLSVHSSVTHSASNQLSACDQLLSEWQKIITDVAAYNADRTSMFDQILLTVLRLDSSSDGFTEKAEMEINARLPIKIPPQVWVEDWLKIHDSIQVTSKYDGIAAYKADKNSPLARAFLHAIRSTGEQPGYVTKSGTADMNIVAPLWGCPAVAYGPGDSALDHTPNEHLSIEEYLHAVQVLKGVIEKLGAGQMLS